MHVPEFAAPVPPSQLPEQQSPFRAQPLPRVLQPLPPGSAAHEPEVQIPVQHCEPAVQPWPCGLQRVPPHVPLQARLQHSPAEAQVAPDGLQNEAGMQVFVPVESHRPEQQSFR